jgi:hypothetical protein
MGGIAIVGVTLGRETWVCIGHLGYRIHGSRNHWFGLEGASLGDAGRDRVGGVRVSSESTPGMSGGGIGMVEIGSIRIGKRRRGQG